MVFCCCLSPSEEDDWNDNEIIPYFWETDIADHFFGEFSFAVLQGNPEIEDQIQVVVDHGAVFCGVYDGLVGVHASRYVVDNLYNNFRGHAQRSGMISGFTILNAIVDTENRFLDTVQEEFIHNQSIAANCSCCLVGVLAGGILHYANLGDSRAVLGSVDVCGNIVAEQLTQDHNVNVKEVRREYEASHPGNDDLLVKVNGIWNIKGIIPVTRCIGGGNFKMDNLAIQDGNFHIPGRTQRPLLSAIPSVQARELRPADRFVIFASNGLWELLTNHEAVQMVHNGPPKGAAKRLVIKALRKKAEQIGVTFDELMELDIEMRREYLDGISVIVLFVDHNLLQNIRDMPALSVRAFDDDDESE